MPKLLKISSKGQVTLPRELRTALSLKTGDELVYTLVGDRFLVTPKNVDFNDLAGFLGAPPKGRATLGQIDETVAREGGAAAAEPLRRTTKRTAA
ncbi:AbrB/MazE/SpoVT family DNA-binding domain-containing protein [Mesorhizobium sp. ZC-5]|uniref:AbrB/MazE/SpoVT family DNA-binding domain-containing protein n=1 Tax=Mesorhizobium sp. ZC-5 TaxID=2986066 RepID=UPI0021E8C0BA|nr:AbrB/MazE/SpoVT family DNA-binding domain-containing protein [Mesorhizobium sp. ZC-5]MCV3238752.1 AbrB/MazE/SpoVT family DNA-binding domain-containing protein [Mesorhizobium sp. ZC-5]